MNKDEFNRLRKVTFNEGRRSRAIHKPVPVTGKSEYLDSLQNMADLLHEFRIEYALVLNDVSDCGDDISIELKEELNQNRADFFVHIETAAGLMDATMTDICHAAGTDYNSIKKSFKSGSDDFDDTDILRLAGLMQEELIALKDTYKNGKRAHDTLISYYIASKPLEEYVENPESLAP
jgi:hypothetical protein